MRLRLEALHGQATGGAALDEAAGKRIAAEAKEWMRAAGIQPANAGSARQSGQPGNPAAVEAPAAPAAPGSLMGR